MPLTVLSVAYPFAPVSSDSCGGSEQVLHRLDRALVDTGHSSIVIAQEGSVAAGTLIPVEGATGILDAARELAWERHRRAIAVALARWPVDLVHLHGIDFFAYVPPPPVPVLVTLHLPVGWYPPEALTLARPDFWIQCVSKTQHASCPTGAHVLPPIDNGVPLDELRARHAKRKFALFLGRICPEKGVHLAIDAARIAKVPILIAGNVSAYEAHRRYFEEEVTPRLDACCRYIGPVGFARKRRLLSAARCLLVPSLAPETSSLAAREAIACGTPVVAFASGALPETIQHGETGFLVETVDEMATAIRRTGELSPTACRRVAAERFSLERMTRSYLDTYGLIGLRAAAPRQAGR